MSIKDDERVDAIIDEALESFRNSIVVLQAKLARAIEGQPCGHALAYIASSEEGTQYCRKCAEARTIEADLRKDIARKDAALEKIARGDGTRNLSAFQDGTERDIARSALSPLPDEQKAA